MKKSSPKISTPDLHLATYLTLHGVEPELSLQGGRILFLFEPTEDYYRLSNDFNANTAVRVLDFCQTLRRLKGRMLSEKDRSLRGDCRGSSKQPA